MQAYLLLQRQIILPDNKQTEQPVTLRMNKGTKYQLSDRIWRAIGATEEFLALRYRPGYTPRQVMEIRGSFIYFSFILSITLIASVFQALARVTHAAITAPLLLNLVAALFAFLNYSKKRALQNSTRIEWTAAILFAVNVIMARYIYALIIGWDFALSSYNLSVFLISSAISCIMLYNRKLFRVVFLLILVNWIVFLIVAKLCGAHMTLRVTGNTSAYGDFNILRELFIIIIYMFLSAAVYIYMSILAAYEKRSVQQQNTIADYNRFLSDEVDKKTAELQNELNERIRTGESLRILSEAVKFSPVGISVTDTEGSILYANPWFESVTGYSLDEIMGRRPGPMLNKNMSREERKAIYNIVRSGGEWRGELRNIRKNGEEFWDRVAISSIRDAENRITHYVAIQEDVTERKKIEEELSESENRLKERNAIIEKDISIAEVVQKALLRFDRAGVQSFSVQYRQKCVEKIGGDFFSVKDHPSGAMGIFIGDVTGHGVASALFTSLLKFITDELFTRHWNRPSEFLNSLNSGISGYMSNYFLTGICAFIHRGEGEGNFDLLFSNGGHPSPVIVRADAGVSIAQSRGPLIGCSISPSYADYSMKLERGDQLFLFTDGLTETTCADTGNILGSESGLVQLFSDAAHGETGVVLDRIMHALDRLRGTGAIEDDLLIIGIKMP